MSELKCLLAESNEPRGRYKLILMKPKGRTDSSMYYAIEDTFLDTEDNGLFFQDDIDEIKRKLPKLRNWAEEIARFKPGVYKFIVDDYPFGSVVDYKTEYII